MYNSKYYTCEQIDQRLLEGYYDDAVAAGYTGSKAQYLAGLLKAINYSANPTITADKVVYNQAISGLTSKNIQDALDEVSSIGHFAKRGGIVNISTNYNSTNTAEVLTLPKVLGKVPSTDRVLGFQGKYLATDGWHTIIYIGDSLTSWSDTTKWIDLSDKILRSISKNATFAGIATPTTNPGTLDGLVFYLATTVGVYENFSGIEVAEGEAVILQWNGSAWTKIITGLVSESSFSSLKNSNTKFNAFFKSSIKTYAFNKNIESGYNIIEAELSLEIGKSYILMLENPADSTIIFWGKKASDLGNTALAELNSGDVFAEFLYDDEYINKQIQSSENNTVYIIENNSELLKTISQLQGKVEKIEASTTSIEKDLYGDSSTYPTNSVKVNSKYTSVKSYIEQGLIYKFEVTGTFTQAILYGNEAGGGLSALVTLTPQDNQQTVTIPSNDYINFQFDILGYSTDTYIYITQQADTENKGLKYEVEKIKESLSDISIDTENVINNIINDEEAVDTPVMSLVKEGYVFRNGTYVSLEGANVYDITLPAEWEGRYIEIKVGKPQYGFVQSFVEEDGKTVVGTFDAGINVTRVSIPIKARILRLSNLTSTLSEPQASLPSNNSVFTNINNIQEDKKIIDGYLNMLIHDRINKSYMYDYKWGTFDKTVFVFVGDDGPNNLGAIYNVFHEKGVPLCVAIITITGDGFMRDTNYTLLELCKKIEEDGGEVLAHPHDKAITGEEDFETLLQKLKEKKQYFLSYGFQARGIIAVGAGITGNANLDRALRGNFEFSDHYGLLTSEAYNCKNPDGGYGRSWIGGWGNTLEEIKQKIDTFAETPQLVVVGMHNYDMSSPSNYPKNEDPETLGQVIDYIKSKENCAIMSYSKAYDTYAKRTLE